MNKGMSLKSKLERLSEEEEKYLEKEISRISEKGKTIAINGLFIAGGLAISYLLFKFFLDNEKPKKDAKSVKNQDNESDEASVSILGGITKSIATEAMVLLLAMAKDKLVEYLNKGTESDEEHTSRTTE